MATNITSQSTNASFPNHGDVISWTVAFSIQFFVSIVGNVLILLIIYKDNRLKTTTNYFMANMAVSDLLAALIAIPNIITSIHIHGNRWLVIGNVHISSAVCKLLSFAVNMCVIVSTYSCVFIAIDRYYAVAHPHSRPFHKKTKYIIAGIWIWSSILTAPEFHFRGLSANKSSCTVSPKDRPFKVFVYFLLVVTSGLALVFIIITYTLTVYKLYRHKAPGLPNSAVRRREQQNKKVLKLAVTVVALLYFCQGTWFIYNMLRFEGKFDHLSPASNRNLRLAATFVFFLSLSYNLFVYLVFNEIYRDNIKAMLSKCCWYCGIKGTVNINDNRTVPGPSAVSEMKTTVNIQN